MDLIYMTFSCFVIASVSIHWNSGFLSVNEYVPALCFLSDALTLFTLVETRGGRSFCPFGIESENAGGANTLIEAPRQSHSVSWSYKGSVYSLCFRQSMWKYLCT